MATPQTVSPETVTPPTTHNGNCVETAERITAQEFLDIAPEDRKVELIDGVIIQPMPPLTIHERLQRFLYLLLTLYVEKQKIGEVFGSREATILNDSYAPEPDILYVSNDGPAEIRREAVYGPPNHVIEILSASTAQADRGPKFLAYEEAGVRELWLIDPYGPAGTQLLPARKRQFPPRSAQCRQRPQIGRNSRFLDRCTQAVA